MAPTLTILATLDGTDGAEPEAPLAIDANGDLIGTATVTLGADGWGTVFELAKTATGYASTPTTLVDFDISDGMQPEGSLIFDSSGDLLTTTVNGGSGGNYYLSGTVIEIPLIAGVYASTATVLANFDVANFADGADPEGGLLADASGDLFGTTIYGGTSPAHGTVFELAQTAGVYASTPDVLVTFDGLDGSEPYGTLIADANGDLFGVTEFGGSTFSAGNTGYGVVFEIVKTAGGYASTPTILADFTGSNGEYPGAGLVADANGDLFGVTQNGGTYDDGTIFEIAKTAGGYAPLITLASFNGTDGKLPLSALLIDADGNLFGATETTVFELAKTASSYATTPIVLANVADEIGGLTVDAEGDLFGTEATTGPDGDGSIFEITDSGFVTNNIYWNGGTGSWDVATNWTPQQVPNSANFVYIVAADTNVVNTSAAGGDAAGTLTISASSTLNIPTSLTVETALANSGSVNVEDGGELTLEGTINNSGTITLAGSVNAPALLQIGGDVSLSGSGQVVGTDLYGSLIVSDGSAATLTLSSSIIGVGTIGYNDNNDNTLTLDVGQGGAVIAEATALSYHLDIKTGSNTVVNNGTLEAETGALASPDYSILEIDSNVDNQNGTIEAVGTDASSGAFVNLGVIAGVTIAGGTLTTSGPGNVAVNVGAATFDGASQGTLTNSGQVDVGDGDTLTLEGTIDNAGVISLVTYAATASLAISGNVTLEGSGKVVLGDFDSTNNIYDQVVSDGAAATLTLSSTVTGVGSIGDQHLSLNIEQSGVIDGTGSGQLVINTGANTITNDGTLEATNGGTLDVASALAGTGSAVIQTGRLVLGNAFSQAVSFTPTDAGTLEIDQTSRFGGTIYDFGVGDTINLKNVAYDPAATVSVEADANGVKDILTVVENGTTYQLKLDPNQDYSGYDFQLSPDSVYGGTDIMMPDVFSDIVASSAPGVSAPYFWSVAGNWSQGVPSNGAAVVAAGFGIDDIDGLSLASLTVDKVTWVLAPSLTVGSTTLDTINGAVLVADAADAGAPVTITIGTIAASGGAYFATGAGAALIINSATDPGALYSAEDGGYVQLAAAPSNATTLLLDKGTGTIALEHPGATVGAALDDLAPGDVLELPGTGVSTVDIGSSSIAITTTGTGGGSVDFTNVTYSEPVTDYTAAFDPTTGLEAISFTGPDVFSDIVASSAPGVSAPYFWSVAGNWSQGVPSNGAAVVAAGFGIDDIDGLSLASLTVDKVTWVLAPSLTVGSTTLDTINGAVLVADAADAGAPVTITIGTIAASGGAYFATGAGAALIINSATDPGALYSAEDGGYVQLAAAPSNATTLLLDKGTGTIALEHPGATIGAALDDLAPGDVLELPGTGVSTVDIGSSSIAITTTGTGGGSVDFTNVTYSEPVTDYTAAFDPTTGLEAITFTGPGIFWNGGIGSWDVAGNWTPQEVPTGSDVVYIVAAGTNVVNTSAAGGDAAGTLTISASSTLNIPTSFTVEAALNNSGSLNVEDGGELTLEGTINNSGTFNLISNASSAAELSISGYVTLAGDGSVVLSSGPTTTTALPSILSAGPGATLDTSNDISGIGRIGDGDTTLTLINEQGGIIDGTGSGQLTINTGTNIITNEGALEAENGGSLDVLSNVDGSGSAVIGNATIELGGSFAEDASFTTGDAGTLQIDHYALFDGTISGFTVGDAIELGDVKYDSAWTAGIEPNSNNVLQFVENGTSYTLDLDPADDFVGHDFLLSSIDGGAGTAITVGQVPITGTVTIPAGETASDVVVGNGGELIVAPGGSETGATVTNGGTLNVESDATANGGTVSSGGTLNVSSGGTASGITVSDGGHQYVESGGTANDTVLTDPGIQIVVSGGTASNTVDGGEQDVYGSADSTTVINGGIEIVETGGFAIGATVSSTGDLTVDSGGVVAGDTLMTAGGEVILDAGAVVSSGASFSFSGVGNTLQIDGPPLPVTVLSGFVNGDTIALPGAAGGSIGTVASSAGDTSVEILDSDGNDLGTLDLDGNYLLKNLALDASGNFTTDQTAPCFCAGTWIEMRRGQKRVENLKIGDKVMTAAGTARPIKWIGRRSYNSRFVMGRKDILPICIKAGALDDNVPKRDLWISPNHAMYLDGVLIEAEDLVNGVSIVQTEHADKIEYFHVELDSHDVIIAEGAFSESFIDDDSRGMFHNAHEYRELYANAAPAAARYCAPRLDQGYELELIRQRLARRAGLAPSDERMRARDLHGFLDRVTPCIIEGWAQNPDHPEAPVCLDIFAGGQLIGQVLANCYRDDLKRAGIGSGCHSFTFAPPARLAFAPDAVEVRRSLDGVALELTDRARPLVGPKQAERAPASRAN